MTSGVAGVDAYLAALPADQARALHDLRTTLARLLPGHLEQMSYAMPGFRQPGRHGKMVAGFAAFRHHLGFYPHSGRVIPQLQAECAGFRTSKSGVLFTPDHPLPEALIRLILITREAEIAGDAGLR